MLLLEARERQEVEHGGPDAPLLFEGSLCSEPRILKDGDLDYSAGGISGGRSASFGCSWPVKSEPRPGSLPPSSGSGLGTYAFR